MHQKCSNYALTNLLFGLCKFVWIVDLLVTLLNLHFGTPTWPSTPKPWQAKEHAPTLYPSVIFTFWTHGWVHKGVWGCVTIYYIIFKFRISQEWKSQLHQSDKKKVKHLLLHLWNNSKALNVLANTFHMSQYHGFQVPTFWDGIMLNNIQASLMLPCFA